MFTGSLTSSLSSRYWTRIVVANLAIAYCHPLIQAQEVAAQVVDVEQQAHETRQQLTQQLAALDGQSLRARLIQSAGDQRLAHWYNAQIEVDNRWLTVNDIEQGAADEPAYADYLDRRRQASDTLADHQQLAKWCEKQKLDDLAGMHWMHVLRFKSRHPAALSYLKLTWYDGWLLTEDEADRYRQQQRDWARENKSWQATAKRLRRDLEKGDREARRAARHQLLAINEPAAVPALLEEFGKPADTPEQDAALHSELVTVLGKFDTPAAIDTLAEIAALSPHKDVRYSAIEQLKSKPLETYVPTLLEALAMPVESSVSIHNIGNRVVASYEYSQEKADGKQHTEYRNSYRTVNAPRYIAVPQYTRGDYIPQRTVPGRTVRVPKRPGYGRGWIPHRTSGYCVNGVYYSHVVKKLGYGSEYLKDVKLPDVTVGGYYAMNYVKDGYLDNPAFYRQQQVMQERLQNEARQEDDAIAQHNLAVQQQNERITGVLTEVTGEKLNTFPKSWWNWWSDYLDANPGVANAGSRQRLNAALLNQQQRGLARGSLVWTRSGKRPVEAIFPGDYVLAQDPETGELAYQLVLAIAAPQTLPVSKIILDESDVHCAPGHVVWSAGTGWQRVSALTNTCSLHCTATAARVQQVDQAFEIETYDLIVDNFHTFFVGQQGALVHDATPIAPTYLALPGLSPAAVAEAAKLVAVK